MNIKRRLIVALAFMILLPCILIGGLGGVAFRIHTHRINQVLGRDYDVVEVVSGPIRVFTEISSEVYNDIVAVANRTPKVFEDGNWLAEKNRELQGRYSYLVIRVNGRNSYIGDNDHFPQVEKEYTSITSKITKDFNEVIFLNSSNSSMFRHYSFVSGDGNTIDIGVITNVEVIVDGIRKGLMRIVFFAILAIAFTAIGVVSWMYSGILKPLHSLKQATKEIERGNLNYTLERNSKDEIGELFEDFEEMRRHLKTQIDARERSEKEFREMISNVSHDLKTPLTAVKGYAEGIRDGVASTPDKQQKYLKSIIAKTNDMNALVSELSLYSKLDSGVLEYRFERINANQYFKDCVDEYSIGFEMEDVIIDFETDLPNDTIIRIDSEQIKRVMNNLVGNAVKYRREDVQCQVLIKLMDAGDSVRVFVNDNGIGISKQALPYIFDRFFRSDRARTSGKAGTGLGLAIVDRIVEGHGGRVFARSELGKGTTISFTIQKGK